MAVEEKRALKPWTQEEADALQAAVNQIFGEEATGTELTGMKFSLTIADPQISGCPLIGCSAGFTDLCGYEMAEIVGRNCRFLVDPVPPELVDKETRSKARSFCEAVRDGVDYRMSDEEREAWMPLGCAKGELFCVQTNARKCGKLFRNMFYLRALELDDTPYIIGLQTELSEDGSSHKAVRRACQHLGENMQAVERALAAHFWLTGPLRRQDVLDEDDGFVDNP